VVAAVVSAGAAGAGAGTAAAVVAAAGAVVAWSTMPAAEPIMVVMVEVRDDEVVWCPRPELVARDRSRSLRTSLAKRFLLCNGRVSHAAGGARRWAGPEENSGTGGGWQGGEQQQLRTTNTQTG